MTKKTKSNVGSFAIAKLQAKMRSILAIVALVAAIGFSMAGCDTGTGSSSSSTTTSTPTPGFSLSGSFSGQNGTTSFNLAETSGSSLSVSSLSVSSGRSAGAARAAASAEKAISGVIQDGSFTIKLSGTYNSETGSYTASAAASIIRYTINGAIDDKGKSLGSTATLLVKDGENWNATTYVITESKTPVTIAGTAVESEAGGLPAFARGVWKNHSEDEYSTGDSTLTVNQWDVNYFIVTIMGDDRITDVQRYNVVKITNSGNNYDVIFAFPSYKGTKVQVANAVKDFFKANGITIPEADLSQSKPDYRTLFFGIDNFDQESFDVYDVRFNCVTDAQWKVVDKFYRTNAVDAYLIKQGVAPTTWFGKYRIAFSNSNAKLKWTPYMTMIAAEFETLAEAEALTESDLHEEFYGVEFTR